MVDLDTRKELKILSDKINDSMKRVDDLAQLLHSQSSTSIDTTDGGVIELAAMIADLEARVAALEAKEA